MLVGGAARLWRSKATAIDKPNSAFATPKLQRLVTPSPWIQFPHLVPKMAKIAKMESKTYNGRASLVITHLTTDPPVHCLYMAERTGSFIFSLSLDLEARLNPVSGIK
jgi:hypothetical protein